MKLVTEALHNFPNLQNQKCQKKAVSAQHTTREVTTLGEQTQNSQVGVVLQPPPSRHRQTPRTLRLQHHFPSGITGQSRLVSLAPIRQITIRGTTGVGVGSISNPRRIPDTRTDISLHRMLLRISGKTF